MAGEEIYPKFQGFGSEVGKTRNKEQTCRLSEKFDE